MRNFASRLVRSVVATLLILGWAAANAELVEIDDPDFVTEDSTDLGRNPIWSLQTGMSYAYIAEIEDGCEYNKFTVLSMTDSIDGVQVRFVRDQEWELELDDGDGECEDPMFPENAVLVEDTHDFYAIDADDILHYFGEDSWGIDEETEDPTLCTNDGSWLHGEDGAVRGIIMLSDPFNGARYQQEFYEDEAEDWGKVTAVDATFDDEEGCTIIKEWTPLEPGSVEKKYYCDGILVFIKEQHGMTVAVEYVGDSFDFGPLPGEDSLTFPALEEVGSCELPD